MTYTLLAIFLSSGNVYVERTGLSLQSCAGRAAMARQEADAIFFYALRDRGCSRFTAWVFWAAVRLNGAIK